MKILILTSASSPYAPLILAPVILNHADEICGVLTIDRPPSGATKKIRKVFLQAGARYAILKLVQFGALKVHQRLGKFPTIDGLAAEKGIPRLRFQSMKSIETYDAIHAIKPDIILSVLFENIIPTNVISSASRAALNVHPAPLPRYGGIAPVFWALSKGETATGVTVHMLDKGIDTGDIVGVVEVPILSSDSTHALYIRACLAGAKLLHSVLQSLKAGEISCTPQQENNRTYFNEPTEDAYDDLRGHGHSLYSFKDLIYPLREYRFPVQSDEQAG